MVNQGKFNGKEFAYDIKVKLMRTGKNLTQLGERLGLSKATMSRVTRGCIPSVEVFLAICKHFGMYPMAYWDTSKEKKLEIKVGEKYKFTQGEEFLVKSYNRVLKKVTISIDGLNETNTLEEGTLLRYIEKY